MTRPFAVMSRLEVGRLSSAGMSDQTTPITKPLNIPRVIGFSFQDYRANEITKARSAECRSCGRTVKEKAGTTSNFLRHLRKHHPDLYQLYQDSKQTGTVPTSTTTKVTTVAVEKPRPSKARTAKPKQDRKHVEVIVKTADVIAKSLQAPRKKDIVVEAVVDLIIDEHLPLDFGESEKLHTFLKRLGSKFKPVTQDMVISALAYRTALIISDMHHRLADVPSVNITVNTWTDSVKKTFISITAHFLEEHRSGLELCSLLLSCQRLLGVTNTDEVLTFLRQVLDDFRISTKVDFVIVPDMKAMKISHSLSFIATKNAMPDCSLDNGAYFDDEDIWYPLNETCMGALKAEVHNCVRYSQLSCFSHTLSLCVDDVIQKTECIQGAITKVCCLVTQSYSNPQLQELVALNGSNFNDLIRNTRKWQHTMMSVKAIAYCSYEKLQALSPPQFALECDELELLKELDYMMGPFLQAIKQAKSGINHTVSAVLPTVLSLYKHLLNVRNRARYLSDATTELADALYCNFKGVFANVGMTGPEVEVASMQEFGDSIYMLATVLDPTYGLHWLEDVHADNSAKSILKRRVLDDVLIEAESTACLESSVSQQKTDDGSPKRKVMKLAPELSKTEIFDHAKACAQLDEYLSMVEDGSEGFTCFQFWAKYRTRFHLLYPVARRVLAVPATEVKMEDVVAYGGIFTKQKQPTLTSRTLSDLLFLKVNRNYSSHTLKI